MLCQYNYNSFSIIVIRNYLRIFLGFLKKEFELALRYLTSFCICQYSDGRSEFASLRRSGVSSSSSDSDELSSNESSGSTAGARALWLLFRKKKTVKVDFKHIWKHYTYGLFTRWDCDCEFFIEINGLYGNKCKCSHGAIAPTTLNPIEPTNCDKNIQVPIVPCERPFMKQSYFRNLPKANGVNHLFAARS